MLGLILLIIQLILMVSAFKMINKSQKVTNEALDLLDDVLEKERLRIELIYLLEKREIKWTIYYDTVVSPADNPQVQAGAIQWILQQIENETKLINAKKEEINNLGNKNVADNQQSGTADEVLHSSKRQE